MASAKPSQKDCVSCASQAAKKSAHHVKRAVGQVDHVHDPKDQGQTRGQQEQHQTELQAVEGLLEKQDPGHK